MLPAQFTDVATQLAGGRSFQWLILLQQGGEVQLLGGIVPCQGLAGAIALPMVRGHLAGGGDRCAGAVAVSGQLDLADFNKTLVVSAGDPAGTDGESYAGPVQSRAGGRADV
ncbi:phage tail length tape measure family protein [Escherichia coli]